jgi:hypothetical protein
MGLGLLLLASYGKENVIVSQNPEITYFKKVYKKHTHFSFEVLPQYFKSTANFGRRVTLNISKTADLINNITLFIELPEIHMSKHSSLPDDIKQFAWVKKIGLAIIKYIDIEIGGVLINRHYNDWLNIFHELYYHNGINDIIGKEIKVITDYTNGKKSYKLYIPLKFFFNLEDSLSLPIVALSKQDVKLHLEFNDFSYCHNETPTHYFEVDSTICLFNKNEYIRQKVDGIKAVGQFVYFDINTKRVYYNKVQNDFIMATLDNSKYDIIGDDSLYSAHPKNNTLFIKDESYFYTNYPVLKDSYLLVNYVYLDSNERWFFMNNKMSYIVPLIQNVIDKDIASINNNYKLHLSNPHKILLWRAQLVSNKEINDHFNYTSLPLTTSNEPLITSNKLIINSIARTEISNFQYYTYLQNYLNKFTSSVGIYQYSFGLNTNENKANGTLNFSKMDDSYIQLNLNKIVNYQTLINIKAYGIYYNIFVIKDGTSSMKFHI